MQYTSSRDLNRATAYVYVEKENKNTIARGFFFGHADSLFLATNKHVVVNAKELVISLYTDIKEPCYIYIQELQEQVILHPQDNIDIFLIRLNGNNLSFSPKYINLGSSQINYIQESTIITKIYQ